MTHSSTRTVPTLSMPVESEQAIAENRGLEPSAADLAGLRASHAERKSQTDPGSARPSETRFDPIAWRQGGQQASPQPTLHDSSRPIARTYVGPSLGHGRLDDDRDDLLSRHPVAAMPRAAGGGAWRYAAVWAGLGAVSAGFIAISAWQRSAQIDMALAPVTESLERVVSDIADLKQVTAGIDQRERATADRVSATETRLSGLNQTAGLAVSQAAVPAAGQGQRPTNRQVLVEEPRAPVAPVVAAAAEPAKPTRVIAGIALANTTPPPAAPAGAVAALDSKGKIAAAKGSAANPIRTGSVVPEPTTATEAPKRPSGLLIASGPSLDAVRLSWNVLHQNHGVVLGALEPRILPSVDGSAFQLIAGPFANDAEAQKTCITLRSRGVTCRAADFVGAAL